VLYKNDNIYLFIYETNQVVVTVQNYFIFSSFRLVKDRGGERV